MPDTVVLSQFTISVLNGGKQNLALMFHNYLVPAVVVVVDMLHLKIFDGKLLF